MKNLELYIPKLEDYWYEEKIKKDKGRYECGILRNLNIEEKDILK